jgi:hypothetical protein
MNTGRNFSVSQWLRSRTGLIFLAFLGIVTFFLVTEHTAHFFGILPYALLLLCPLLHLLMHGGHGGHDGHAEPHEHSSEEKK